MSNETTQEIKKFERDPKTGLVIGVDYKYLPDGKIDWKAMLNPAHIVFNSKNKKAAEEIQKAYGAAADKLVYADVIKTQSVDDKHILILLKGFQEVAELRGFTSSVPTTLQVAQGIVAVAHAISWIPNFEDPQGKITGATADATMENTGGFGYLAAMAGNRAFVRAVRQGLGISILAFDEIAKRDESENNEAGSSSSSVSSSVPTPQNILAKIVSDAGFTFEQLKKSAIEKHKDKLRNDPALWNNFSDIPSFDAMKMIELVQAGVKAAKSKK